MCENWKPFNSVSVHTSGGDLVLRSFVRLPLNPLIKLVSLFHKLYLIGGTGVGGSFAAISSVIMVGSGGGTGLGLSGLDHAAFWFGGCP